MAVKKKTCPGTAGCGQATPQLKQAEEKPRHFPVCIYIYIYIHIYIYIYIGPPAAAPKAGPQAEFASLRLLSYLEGPRTQIMRF